jgi:hypothetical protein
MSDDSEQEFREHVAYHEAGHFVVAHVLGLGVLDVTIEPKGETLGRVESDEGEPTSVESLLHQVIELYAGYEAWVRFDPSSEEKARLGASEDDEQANGYLLRLGKKGPDQERELRERAKQLVEEHWRAIEALANELLEAGRISVCAGELIIEVAKGETDPVELAEYRRFPGLQG